METFMWHTYLECKEFSIIYQIFRRLHLQKAVPQGSVFSVMLFGLAIKERDGKDGKGDFLCCSCLSTSGCILLIGMRGLRLGRVLMSRKECHQVWETNFRRGASPAWKTAYCTSHLQEKRSPARESPGSVGCDR